MEETGVPFLGPEEGMSLEKEMAILAGKSHGQRSLAGSSPRGHAELDMTERAHALLSCKKLAPSSEYLSSVCFFSC